MEVKGNFVNYGPYVDVHDNEVVNLSIDKAGKVEVKTHGVSASLSERGEPAAGEAAARTGVPEVLQTEEAERLWQRLREAGFIAAEGYALAEGVSANQATYIADSMARKLGLTNKWKVFQQLWNIKNMAQLAGSWQQSGKLPPKNKEIDEVLK
jgi:hypothetical protein